jgi:phosphate:Na+ symporter
MALTLVMSYNGWIGLEVAAAMVLGENIGTTITANLAALMANVEAKRAARSHFLFNVIGVIWILILFYPVINMLSNLMFELTGFDPRVAQNAKEVLPTTLALFHTFFNVANTCLLVGFIPQIAKLSTLMVKSKKEDTEEVFKLTYIDKSFFQTGELSLIQTQKELTEFSKILLKMFEYVNQLVFEDNPKDYQSLMARIDKNEVITDQMEEEIATYLSYISEGQLSHQSALLVRSILHIIDDMESAADVMYQISKVIEEKNNMKQILSEQQLSDLAIMRNFVSKALTLMNDNLKNWDNADVVKAATIESSMNTYRDVLRDKHIENLKNKKYKFKTGTYYLQLVTFYEKIGDYVFNVSEAIDKSNHENVKPFE